MKKNCAADFISAKDFLFLSTSAFYLHYPFNFFPMLQNELGEFSLERVLPFIFLAPFFESLNEVM